MHARFGPGLTSEEASRAEQLFGFVFPPDLRELLSLVLPLGREFPNWRDPESVRPRMDWPFQGIAFDIEHGFWRRNWGTRPSDTVEALAIARTAVGEAPKLVPIWGHRYIPADPPEAGNPVLSVYQTDIVFYGGNLRKYLRLECRTISHEEAMSGEVRRIPFWTELVEENIEGDEAG